MIVKIIVLLGLTRLVVATHQPFLCSAWTIPVRGGWK